VNNNNASACHGPGGGGGGGVVRISNTPSANVIVQRNGGAPGPFDNGATCAQNVGQPGAEGVTEIDPFINDSPCALTLLPVEMISFRAQSDLEQARVGLFWSTASERDSRHFVVERSADGTHFAPLGQVAAAGQSMRRIDYHFTDTQPLPGTSYYRLQQVDLDGSFTYSRVVVVYFTERVAQLTLFPNPATDQLNLRLNNLPTGKVTVQLANLLGQELHNTISQHNGSYLWEGNVAIGHLPKGQYVVRVTTQGGLAFTQKIVRE
jgi:hypothetical protein